MTNSYMSTWHMVDFNYQDDGFGNLMYTPYDMFDYNVITMLEEQDV